MNLWVISTQESFAQYTLRRLTEEAPGLGVHLRVFKPGEVDCFVQNAGSRLTFNGEELEPPQVLLVRTGASTITYQTLALMRMLELTGATRVINSFSTFSKAKDKFLTLMHLTAQGIPVPKTQLLNGNYSLEQLKDEFRFPVVVKEISGARGSSVIFSPSPDHLDELLQLLFTVKKLTAEFVVEECIHTSIGRDIRNYVVGERILGSIERKAKGGGRKANVSLGGDVREIELTREIAEIVRRVQHALGLEIGAVDLLYGEEGYQVCEVNLSAQFLGFEKATSINVAEAILRYCLASERQSQDPVPLPRWRRLLGRATGAAG